MQNLETVEAMQTEMEVRTTERIEALKEIVTESYKESQKITYKKGFEDGRKSMYQELKENNIFEEDEVSKRISDSMDWADNVDKMFESGAIKLDIDDEY